MRYALALVAMLAAAPAAAQQFTTAAEVKPILEATRANWVAVREFDGKDLVYFTQILSWRCGLTSLQVSVNSAATDTVFPLEPCHEGTAQPNAMVDAGYLPYAEAPLGSVQSVSVLIGLDDGTYLTGSFQRAQVLMP